MSQVTLRDGVFCGLGIAIGAVQECLDECPSVEGRELLRAVKDRISIAGARWSKDHRDMDWPKFMSEEVTPT